jgi:hypothetical protein
VCVGQPPPLAPAAGLVTCAMHCLGMSAPPRPGRQGTVSTARHSLHCTLMYVALCCGRLIEPWVGIKV